MRNVRLIERCAAATLLILAMPAAARAAVASKDLLRIDGKIYRRCPEKAASAKAGKQAKKPVRQP